MVVKTGSGGDTSAADAAAAAAGGDGDGGSATAVADGDGDGADGSADDGDGDDAGEGGADDGDDDGDAASGSDGDDDGDAPQGAPDSYELEKFESMGGEVLDAVAEVAKELDLPQKSVNKLLDAVMPKAAKQRESGIKQFKAGLLKEAKAEVELAGKGGKDWNKNRARALEGLEAIHPPLVEWLKESGLENQRDVLLMGKKLGDLMVDDDNVVTAGGDGDNEDSGPLTFKKAAQKLYGKKKGK